MKNTTKQYRNGVAFVNAMMALEFGKEQFILTRGDGYHYWRGESNAAWQMDSIYCADMSLATPRGRIFVECETKRAIEAARALLADR